MTHSGKAESAIWSRLSAHVDAMVVGCMVSVAAIGLVVLSPPAEPTRSLAQIETAAPAQPAPRARSASGLAPQYFPWKAPEAYVPQLPEFAEKLPLPGSQQARMTRLQTPREDAMLLPANFDVSGSHYGCNWRMENIEPTSSGALLAVHRVSKESQPCTAGEMQSPDNYSYGRYEVIMRPARGSGIVSSFFTYTGAYFGDPHDEIDIEFLGKDTTQVHFNYFRKGKTGADEIFDLPFDAAEADRLYAFEWTPEGITWFVEGVPYYKTPANDAGLPVAPGKIYLNAWAGEDWIDAWTGPKTYKSGTGAHYSCVSFVPLGGTGPSCADIYQPPVTLSP